MKTRTLKLTQAALACALALGGSSAFAAAACGGSYTVDVFLAGASAVQNDLVAIADELFSTGYTVAFDSTKGSNYRAICGVLKSDNTTTTRLVYRAFGGSGYGVFPQLTGTAIDMMDTTAGCTAVNPNGTLSQKFPNAGAGYTCPNVITAAKVPDLGVSDVEPAMFVDVNVPVAFSALDAATLNSMTTAPGYQNVFGLAATTNTGLTDISRAMYASIATGTVKNWNAVTGSSLSGNIVVCRRDAGSGSQATSNAYFLGNPCSVNGDTGESAAQSPLDQYDTAAYTGSGGGTSSSPMLIDPSKSNTFVQLASSGDVRSCLTAASTGADFTYTDITGTVNKVQFSKGCGNGAGTACGAIGVLSVDSVNNIVSTGGSGVSSIGFNFLTLNGQAIQSGLGAAATVNIANERSGAYDYAYENTFNYVQSAYSALPAKAQTFITNLITKVQNPATIATLTAPLNVSYSNVPTTAFPYGATNPSVARWTRGGNSCSTPYMPK